MTDGDVEFEGDLTRGASAPQLGGFDDPPDPGEYEVEVGDGGETLGNAVSRGIEIDLEGRGGKRSGVEARCSPTMAGSPAGIRSAGERRRFAA